AGAVWDRVSGWGQLAGGVADHECGEPRGAQAGDERLRIGGVAEPADADAEERAARDADDARLEAGSAELRSEGLRARGFAEGARLRGEGGPLRLAGRGALGAGRRGGPAGALPLGASGAGFVRDAPAARDLLAPDQVGELRGPAGECRGLRDRLAGGPGQAGRAARAREPEQAEGAVGARGVVAREALEVDDGAGRLPGCEQPLAESEERLRGLRGG